MRKLANWLNDITEKFGIVFLIMMLLIVSMQVITRLTIRTTPRWTEEVAAILMVCFSFLGIAIGVKEKIHIAITFFTDLLPKKVKKVVLVTDELLVMFFGASLLWFGARLVYATRTSTMPATQWPAYTPYLILPLAGAAVVIYCIVNIMDIVQDKNDGRLEN